MTTSWPQDVASDNPSVAVHLEDLRDVLGERGVIVHDEHALHFSPSSHDRTVPRSIAEPDVSFQIHYCADLTRPVAPSVTVTRRDWCGARSSPFPGAIS